MRFSCDSCGAQYMISDDKVGAGGVKVRCKRCGHIVLVKSASAAAPVVEPGPPAPEGAPPPSAEGAQSAESGLDAELGQAFDHAFGDAPPAAEKEELPAPGQAPAAAAAAPAAPVEWYVAIDDRQVGPLLAAGVKARWESGEVGPDTLVWKAGMGDWSPLSGVPELAQLLAPVPRPARAAARPAEAAAAPEPARAAAPAPEPARGPDPGWKPAAASALARLASEEMASMAKPGEKPEGSLVEKLQLPEGGVDPTGMLPLHLKGVENTGETLLSRKGRESTEVRNLRKSTNRRLVVAVVVITALFGGAIAWMTSTMGLWHLPSSLVAGTPVPAPGQAAAPSGPAAPVGAAAPPVAPAPAPPSGPATPAPAAPATLPATAEVKPPPPAEPKVAAAAPEARPAAAEPPKAAPPPKKPKPEQAKAKTKPKSVAAAEKPPARKQGGDPLLDPGSGDDDLSRELAGVGGKKKSVYVPPAPGSDLPDRVTDSQIIEAIVGKKASLQACVEEQRGAGGDARGPLMLKWTIAPDGSAKDLKSLSEGLARQPIVGCISGVVRSTRFPRSRLGREVEAFPFKF